MPYLRVDLIGAGTPADPRRVQLPTYQMIDADLVTGVAIVWVPDSDVLDSAVPGLVQRTAIHPGDPITLGHLGPPPGVPVPASRDFGNVITRVAPPHETAWLAVLDERYQEHRGEYALRIG